MAEIEAVTNTQPLTHVCDHFEFGFILTPAHLLTVNLPIMDTELDYCVTKDSASDLLNHWKKGQKQLNIFWDIWKNEYLLRLHEISLYHQTVKGQIPTVPKVGQVVIIKDDSVPQGIWKVGKIERLIESSDGHICTAPVRIPNYQSIKEL